MLVGPVLVVAGALVLLLTLRLRRSDAPGVASPNPADWKHAGILGLNSFTPRGQKLYLVGWTLFLLGVMLSAIRN